MADSKLSALTEKTTLTGAEEVYINDGGTSKKATLTNALGTLGALGTGTQQTLIAVGDSIALTGTRPEVNSPIRPIAVVNALCDSRFEIINRGISGETTTETLARFASDGMDVSGDIVFYCGTNDQGASISASTAISNITAISNMAIADGRKFIFCTLMPTDNDAAVTSSGAEKRVYRSTLNEWARRYALSTSGFYIADTESAGTDTTTGVLYAAYSTDGIHPNALGAQQIARPLAELLTSIYPDLDTGVWSIYDPKNLIPSVTALAAGDNADGAAGFDLVANTSGTGPNGWSTVTRYPDADTGVYLAVASGGIAATDPAWSNAVYGRMELTLGAGATQSAGAGFKVGGDNVNAKGRWDTMWGASKAYTYGDRCLALTGRVFGGLYDDFTYVCMVPGTSAAGGAEPTWADHLVEGELFTDNGVTWMTVRKPVEGDVLQGEADIQISGLVGEAAVRVTLYFQYAGGPLDFVEGIAYDLTVSADSPFPDYQPSRMRIRTDKYTVTALPGTIRYLLMEIQAHGMPSSALTIDVSRVRVKNLTTAG